MPARRHPPLLLRRLLLLAVLLGLCPIASRAQEGLWLMKGHDARRTGQSRINGPLALDPAASWTVALPAAHTINIGATVTQGGVFFGSWGLLRRDPAHPVDPRLWDKSDGQLFGLALASGDALWGAPLDLDLVPRCYDFPGRGPNLIWCGLTPYEVSFYNGTVEGQAAMDLSRNVLYVGRGDGRLFAIDPDAGQILWRFVTFNPQLPDDPDGGGEVISSPLLGPDGTVYFGTWGEGPFETHAVYAVNPGGTLQWRFPADASLTHRIFAAPALSPDGATIYVASFRDDDGNQPATLYAFHRDPTGPAPDAQRLKWSVDLAVGNRPVQAATLAVGSDGTVYVGGLLAEGFGVPVLAAVADQGTAGAFIWPTPFLELRDGAQYVLGLALREVGGVTQRLYVTTANLGTVLFNSREEGTLYALDPASGAVLASYDPSDDVPEAVGSVNSPAIGADGTLYIGVRGRYGNNARAGHYFAVAYDAATARFTKRWHTAVDGYVEWNHPAIGPDGGLYAGSSSLDDTARTPTYDEGETPEGTTAYFHALKGPTTTVATEDAPPDLPFRLGAPYPNPSATGTTLPLDLAGPGRVRADVFDLLGRRVRTLTHGRRAAGRHLIAWEGTDDADRPVAGGIYIVRLHVSDAATGRVFRAAHRLVRRP